MWPPRLEGHLVLVAEIERLQVPAAPQIPHMHPVSVFLAEQELFPTRWRAGRRTRDATRNRRPAPAVPDRRAVPNVKLTGKADPAKKIRVSVYVRRNPDEAVRAAKMTESFSGAYLSQRRYLSRDDAARTYGADAADVEAVTHWAKRLGLTAVNDPEESARTRRILLEGTIGAFEKAFLVELNTYRHPRYGEFRGRDAEIHVPAFLQSIVDGVFGLDTRRVGRARHRVLNVRPQKIRAVQPTTQWPGTFFPPQAAELYEYPRGTDGAGQNVAIFAFNGDGPHGYGGYRETALSAYFEMLGGSAPSIADVVVSGPGRRRAARPDGAC